MSLSISVISYTNEATMREKLVYAIYHCTAIDGDDTSLGMRSYDHTVRTYMLIKILFFVLIVL